MLNNNKLLHLFIYLSIFHFGLLCALSAPSIIPIFLQLSLSVTHTTATSAAELSVQRAKVMQSAGVRM